MPCTFWDDEEGIHIPGNDSGSTGIGLSFTVPAGFTIDSGSEAGMTGILCGGRDMCECLRISNSLKLVHLPCSKLYQ